LGSTIVEVSIRIGPEDVLESYPSGGYTIVEVSIRIGPEDVLESYQSGGLSGIGFVGRFGSSGKIGGTGHPGIGRITGGEG